MSTNVQTTGRRKTAVARCLLKDGDGKIEINNRSLEDYFPLLSHQNRILEPFIITDLNKKYDVKINAKGGGINGQVDACKLAISRALLLIDPELRSSLKSSGMLKRDPRKKERKKAGQPKARKRFQYSKR